MSGDGGGRGPRRGRAPPSPLPSPDEWRRLEPLVDAVLDAAPHRRPALLAELSGSDRARQAELERLVAECERSYPPLEGVAADRFADVFGDEALPVPELLAGRYRIVREIGRGGMAIVHVARDLKHGRDVAVKIVRPELAAALGRARFLREVEIAARLRHPHIVPLYDSGEEPLEPADAGRGGGAGASLLYYVMPYEAGHSLRERLAHDGPLSVDDAVLILRDVCEALSHAHQHGIVHRDIKPDNVLLSGRHAMVADFGVARAVSEAATEPALSGSGTAFGTLTYMAPEQAANDPRVDFRADIYAVGVLAYELLAGRPPRTGPRSAAPAPDDVAKTLTGLRPDVPAALAALIAKCLAEQPVNRWQRADDLLPHLDAIASAPRALPPAEPSGRPTSRTDDAAARRVWSRRWSAPVAVGLLALLALGATAVVVRSVGSPAAVPAPASPTAIAVLPFAYRGSAQFAYLGEGMVDLLAPKLDGAVGLRSVDPRAIFRIADRDSGAIDPDRARHTAERLGAGLFVLGSVVEAGGRLQVSATVYDGQATPRETMATTASSEAEIFAVADQLARRILAAVQDSPLELARTADQTTASLPALKAYLEGERDLRADRPMKAVEAFERAVRLDSSFALAHFRLGSLTPDSALARESLARALRYGDRLGERHREHVHATDDFLRGNHRAAEQRYRQILAAHPDDVEAWASLGWLHLTQGYLLGGALVDAREPLEHARALDPRNAGAVWGLAVIAARERRLSALDSLTDLYVRLDPTSYYAANVRAMRAVVSGDAAELERFVADVRKRPDSFAQLGAGVVTWATGDLSVGRRLWRLIAEPSRSPRRRVLAHVTLAKIELTNGRWRAARAELDAVGPLDPGSALEQRALFALTRFLRPSRSELLALRDSLRRRDAATAARDGDELLAIQRDAHSYLRLYLLGVLSARLGDEAGALRYAAELERVDRSSPAGAFAADRGRIVRAEVAWSRGRPQEALSLLQGARFWTTNSSLESGDSPFFLHTHLHERFALAELLRELGRDEDALPWYRAFTYDLLYNGPAHLRMAEIYERRGERAKAAEHYRQFVELWKDCDPELRPLVDDARRRLARLADAPA